MSYLADGMLRRDGRVTFPNGVKERLGIKVGDRLRFHLADSRVLSITVNHLDVLATTIPRRSIFDSIKELEPLSLGRPLTRKISMTLSARR